MKKKEIFEFWDNYYERCPKCDYSIGHYIKKDGKIIHSTCPVCDTLMTELTIEQKEFMLTRM